MNLRRPWLLLSALLIIAAILRFQGLLEQGIFMFDEGSFLFQADKLRHCVTTLWRHLPDAIAGREVEITRYRTFVFDMARPLHLGLLILAGANATGGLFAMAATGVVAVGLLFYLATRLGEANGFAADRTLLFAGAAAFLLATSPSHLFHSRTLLAEVDAGVLLLAALIMLQGKDRAAVHYATGFFLGAALLTQSRLLPIIPLLVLWRAWTLRSFQTLVRIAAGIAAPILLVEVGYALINAGFDRMGASARLPGYIDQMKQRTTWDGGGFALNRPLFGPRYLLLVESAPAILLALGGGVLAIRRRERFLALLLGIALFVTAFASLFDQRHFTEVRYGRMLAPAVPLLALLGAYLLAALPELFRRGRDIALAVILLTLLVRAPLLSEIVSMKSDYDSLFRTVISVAGAPVISDEAIQAMATVGRDQVGTPGFHPAPKAAVFFDREDWRYPLFGALPDTPSFFLARRGLRPTVMTTLEATEDPSFTLRIAPVRPVKVYVFSNQ